MLDSVYGRDPETIATAVEMLLSHNHLTVQEPVSGDISSTVPLKPLITAVTLTDITDASDAVNG